MKRLWQLFALGLVMMVAFVRPSLAQEEIRVGVIYPLTGAAASTGLELKNALELAAN